MIALAILASAAFLYWLWRRHVVLYRELAAYKDRCAALEDEIATLNVEAEERDPRLRAFRRRLRITRECFR